MDACAASPMSEESSAPKVRHKKKIHKHKKNKSKKHKKNKSKEHQTRKHKKKQKLYSEPKIDKILKNDSQESVCNRLNCASNLQIAQSCLQTKASHRHKTKCFRAFCAYGCNDEDYLTRPDVYDFCNATCSSKRYLKNRKRPVEFGNENK